MHPTLESLVPQAVLVIIGLFGLRAMRRSRGATAPLTATVQTVPTQEQLHAIQSMAAKLRRELEAGGGTPAQLEAWRNLAGQIEAASRSHPGSDRIL